MRLVKKPSWLRISGSLPALRRVSGVLDLAARSCLCLILAPSLLASELWAQNAFVFTNDDNVVGANSVSGFLIGKNGVLIQVPGSPYPTGGVGGGGGYIAATKIMVVGTFLYATNDSTRNVSGFSIDPHTGSLTPVPGSPFSTGGRVAYGSSVAATVDGQFLYVVSDRSADIRIFRIDPDNGRLTGIGEPVRLPGPVDSANSMKVSSDGRWLALTLILPSPGSVAMFAIDAETGGLTAVEGSPFLVRGVEGRETFAAGVEINCASDALFVAEASLGGTTVVEVFSIDRETGALKPIEGSPFAPKVGQNSNVPLLVLDDSVLYVTNIMDNSIAAFAVAPDGSLTLLDGSPFSAGDTPNPARMVSEPPGSLLHVGKVDPAVVQVFTIQRTGELTPVAVSPFPVGQFAFPLSLVAYPGKSCPTKSK